MGQAQSLAGTQPRVGQQPGLGLDGSIGRGQGLQARGLLVRVLLQGAGRQRRRRGLALLCFVMLRGCAMSVAGHGL
ncbi:MAG: hypothetical protein ACUVWR_19515 [Anaerolineae bacterium]